MLTTVDAIIQARLGSTRLPNKVLLSINGKPLIDLVISKLEASKFINRIIIATTIEPEDDELFDYCLRQRILCFRGDTDDVLSRFIGAGNEYDCNKILRVCSDNPFIDIALLDEQLEMFLQDDQLDYCSYTTSDGTPVVLKPLGMFVEAVTLKALKRVQAISRDTKDKEHVTMFIYEHPELFNIRYIRLEDTINTDFRFTVDYPEDLKFCEEIMELTTDHSMKSLLYLVQNNKTLGEKNMRFSLANRKVYQ